jgi:molybdenum cofactor biosynthesis protein A
MPIHNRSLPKPPEPSAEKMKKTLIDPYGRQLNYLRLSVTDRCNFRCYYCMPEEGMNFVDRKDLLSYEEMEQLTRIFVGLGIDKIRITGGEPFVRRGIMDFLSTISQIDHLNQITVTSNGTLSPAYRAQLKTLGIIKINISMDALDRQRFFEMTRRDRFDEVYQCVMDLLQEGFEVKLNCVVADEKNIADIVPFIQLTEFHALSVRFLEEMPFNGQDTFNLPRWNYQAIFEHILSHFPQVQKITDGANSTSINYKVPGYLGSFGIIPSFSRTFCGTCNRIRLSATGELRTCLYGPPAGNLRDLLRSGATTENIEEELIRIVATRAKDGFAAEALHAKTPTTSMSFLGG